MPIQLSKAQPLDEWYELVNQAMLAPVEAGKEVHFAKRLEATTLVSQLADETQETLEAADQTTDEPDAQAAQLNPWIDQAPSTEQFAQALGYAPKTEEHLAYASDYHEASSITSWFQDTFSAISGLSANSKTWWTAAASAVSGLASETNLLDSFGSDSDDDAQRESDTLGQSSLNAQDQSGSTSGDQDNQSAGSDINPDISAAAQGLISALKPQAAGLSDSNDSSELGAQLALLESQLTVENPDVSTNAAADASAQTSSSLYLFEAAIVVEPIAALEVFGL